MLLHLMGKAFKWSTNSSMIYFILRVWFAIGVRWEKFVARHYYQHQVERTAVVFTAPLRVNRKSRINANTHLGQNVNFNGMTIAGQGRVTIGNNFHSGIDCRIIVQNHNYHSDIAIPYDATYIRKGVTIEDNVWLGDRVIILDGVTIGEGAIIQAGSVVVSNIPACAIAGGHPARPFRTRDVDKYYRLKAEGKVL